MVRSLLSRSTFRALLTILLYFGVALFVFPYLTGRVFTGIALVIAGASVAVVAGLARCFLTEGGCTDGGHLKQRIP